jgi:hypothetical protein
MLASQLVLAGAFLTTGAHPDVYFEQTVVTSSDGQAAAASVVSRVWYAGRKMRMEAGGTPDGPAFILRLDTGKAFRVVPTERSAVEIDLQALRARSQMDVSMAGELMGGDDEPRTAPLKIPRTIAGYACRGFRITGGSAVMDVYVARGVPIGIDSFTEFLEWSGADQALGGLLGEIRKLPGFPLETRTRVNVMGRVHQTLSTVTSIKVGPLPAALFEPPAGYRVTREAPAEEP